jgi:hypothetical protein
MHKVKNRSRPSESRSITWSPNSRDRDSFAFAKETVKPAGVLEHILDWCKLELEADWRWQLVEISTDQRPGRYIFYFDGERDFLAFVLKWC